MNDEGLKILFTSSWYPSKAHPTLGNFVSRHADAVAIYNPVHVLYVSSLDMEKDFEIENFEEGNKKTTIVYYKKIKGDTPILSNLKKLKQYKIAALKGLDFIKEKYGIEKFDVCHHNIHFQAGIIPLHLKKKYGTPYIISENWTGYLPEDRHHYTGIFRKRLTKKIGNKCDIQCPVSIDLQESLVELGIGKGRFEIVPNVVRTDRFKAKINDAKFDEVIRLIHVSTLDEEQKNIKGILNAYQKVLEKFPQCHLTFVNDGDSILAEKHATQLDIANKISFTGKQDAEGVAKHLSQSDIFVLFSNYENLPCVVVEAMASGVPVLASTAGGTHEHLTEEYGELVAPRDEEALTRKIIYMIENYDKYSSDALHKYAVNHFSYEVVGKRFIDIYKQLA